MELYGIYAMTSVVLQCFSQLCTKSGHLFNDQDEHVKSKIDEILECTVNQRLLVSAIHAIHCQA